MNMAVATSTASAAAGTAIGPIELMINGFNSNPYFIGFMMLMLNVGGRFLSMEISKGQEQFLQNPWVRRFLIFAVIFMGTRNILVAFWMTFIIILCIGYLFNENSSLCIFGRGGEAGSLCSKTKEMGPGLTVEESEILLRLQAKAAKQHPVVAASQDGSGSSQETNADIYHKNLSFLQRMGF